MANERILKIPITNYYASGDYTANLLIGQQKTPVNLILDTGSSTLAVKSILDEASGYDPTKDSTLQTTTYYQEITYGTGGWAGPVVNTQVIMTDSKGNEIGLPTAPIAIIDDQEQNNMQGVDGIFGLAFTILDNGNDLSAYLEQTQPNNISTYPWPFGITDLSQFNATIQSIFGPNLPSSVNILPFFTDLEGNSVVANKFAFYTHRSMVYYPSESADPNSIISAPLNKGFFILGGGEEQTDLYTGNFIDVAVTDDEYYNTNLISVQVGNSAPIAVTPAQSPENPNSIVDSGTNGLSLDSELYNSIISELVSFIPEFENMISENNGGSGEPITCQNDQLNLANWPDIKFNFQGATGDTVTLTCTPDTYWQVNAFQYGNSVFNISPGQSPSILGLPLMNNYYCVFDRTMGSTGAIRFAQKAG